MINKDKWISSLPKTNQEYSNTVTQLDYDRWVNTIPKINKIKTYNSVKKHFFIATLFVCGLLFVSVVKN